MNNVCMLARLTRDPEIRTYGDNGVIANFNGAVRKKFKKSENEPDDFFNFVAFGKTAEFIEKYFHKGELILIQGELHNDNYEKEDGTKVYRDKIHVTSVDFAGSKKSDESSGSESRSTTSRRTSGSTSRRGSRRAAVDEFEDDEFY